jgi:hypothetical protein
MVWRTEAQFLAVLGFFFVTETRWTLLPQSTHGRLSGSFPPGKAIEVRMRFHHKLWHGLRSCVDVQTLNLGLQGVVPTQVRGRLHLNYLRNLESQRNENFTYDYNISRLYQRLGVIGDIP